MFLPTKRFEKEVRSNQPRLRKGNRVPEDAINLAYIKSREVSPSENVKITDLSSHVFENQGIDGYIEVEMFPNDRLMLTEADGTSDVNARDVLIADAFEGGVPLFYKHSLGYRIHSKKGPNEYGVLEKHGVMILDGKGKEVKKAYRVEMIEDEDNTGLYFGTVLTSFNDSESESYHVVYNGVEIDKNGMPIPKSGIKEELNLSEAYERVESASDVLKELESKRKKRVYNGRTGNTANTSIFYVPQRESTDSRPYEFFRYQIGVELDFDEKTIVKTTHWIPESVIHTDYMSNEEREQLYSGYKKITEQKIEVLAEHIIEGETDLGTLHSLRYFVNIDNENVRASYRADGSSEIYVKSVARYEDFEKKQLPEKLRVIKRPYEKEGEIELRLRPMRGEEDEEAYISFVVDNSESMSASDPMKVNRISILEGMVNAIKGYYSSYKCNALYFAKNAKEIQFEFNDDDIVEKYWKNAPVDLDVTRPEAGMEKAVELIRAAVSTTEGKRARKIVCLVTDGLYDENGWIDMASEIASAKKDGIEIIVFTFNNLEIMSEVCKSLDVKCYDGRSKNLPLTTSTSIFDLGEKESIKISTIDYSLLPDIKNVFTLTKTHLESTPEFKESVEKMNDLSRWGIELIDKADEDDRKTSLLIKNKGTDKILGTMHTKNIIKVDDVWRESDPNIFEVFVLSNAYKYYTTNVFIVRHINKRKIMLEMPRERNSKESWHIRVQNGRFDRRFMNKKNTPVLTYSLPEYERQDFIKGTKDKVMVKKEKPYLIGESKIQVKHTPLFTNDKKGIEVRVNGQRVSVSSWDNFNGIIQIDGIVGEGDNIEVDYTYTEHCYTYNGYLDDDGVFWHLDLNPTVGHQCTYKDPETGIIKRVPSFILLNKVIYFYLKFSSKTEIGNGTKERMTEYNKYTIFHTFERLVDEDLILFGQVRVRPNSSLESIEVLDTRSRGGGLLEEIDEEDMKSIEPESIYYWDIGYYDGQPFPENGIVVVRISRNVLREYGGQRNKIEVEEIVNKHLALGVLPIIEYLDAPEFLIPKPDGLTVEVEDIEGIGTVEILKPTFDLEVK